MTVRRLLVRGDAIHAWTIAAALAKGYSRKFAEVRVEATGADDRRVRQTPASRSYFAMLGISETGLLQQGATHWRGWQYAFDHGQPMATIPFSSQLPRVGGMEFHRWIGLDAADLLQSMEACCPGTQIASGGITLDTALAKKAGLESGYFMEAAGYARLVRSSAESLGAAACADQDADWIFDARPADASLPGFEPWPEWAHKTLPDTQPTLQDQADGLQQWKQIGDRWSDRSGSATGHTIGTVTSFVGAHTVRMGPAAGSYGPFVFDDLHRTQSAVLRWLDLVTDYSPPPSVCHEYQRRTRLESECIRDLHGLHCAAPPDNAHLPARLQHRISLFQQTGQVAMFEGESMGAALWCRFLTALAGYPGRGSGPRVKLSEAERQRLLAQSRQQCEKTVAALAIQTTESVQ